MLRGLCNHLHCVTVCNTTARITENRGSKLKLVFSEDGCADFSPDMKIVIFVYLPFFKPQPGLSGWLGGKKWGLNVLKWNMGLIFWAINCLNCKHTSVFRYAAHSEADLQRGLTSKPTWGGGGGGRGVHESNHPAAAVSFPRWTGSLFSHQWSELTGQLRNDECFVKTLWCEKQGQLQLCSLNTRIRSFVSPSGGFVCIGLASQTWITLISNSKNPSSKEFTKLRMKAEEVIGHICSEYFTTHERVDVRDEAVTPSSFSSYNKSFINPSFISELWHQFKSCRIQEKRVYWKQLQPHECSITFYDMICCW